MWAHFRHLSSKSFPMIYGTFQSNEFWPLQSLSEDSGVHWDSNSQSGSSLRSVRIHSLTVSCTSENMKCDSWAHSWPAPLQALALIASQRLGLQHCPFICSWILLLVRIMVSLYEFQKTQLSTKPSIKHLVKYSCITKTSPKNATP
jgi:hypothetical protein